MHGRFFELKFHPRQLLNVVILGLHGLHAVNFPVGLEAHSPEDEALVAPMASVAEWLLHYLLDLERECKSAASWCEQSVGSCLRLFRFFGFLLINGG